MKTLDEVIKANECCNHGEPDSRCEDCPYNGIGACCLERESDALHHLKDYKRYQNTPSRHGHMALVDYFDELQKNEPLTWEELKSMKGKPVWVELNSEYGNFSHWGIIRNFLKIGREFEYMELSGYYDLVSFSVGKDKQGKEWQAYRKERKNETD